MENTVMRIAISVVVSAFMLFIYNETIVKAHHDDGISEASFVTFNPIKFFNSQRKYLSSTLDDDGQIRADSALTFAELRNISQKSKQVIRNIAGDAVVLVSQSLMLDDNVKDITDMVLSELELPVDVSANFGMEKTINNLNQFNGNDLYPNYLKQKPITQLHYEQQKNADHAKNYLP